MKDETDDFEVSLLYGEEMSSYTYFGPICENCKTENNFIDESKAHSSNDKCLFCNKKSANNYFKTGSQSHQICINNNFSNKWEKVKGWYMGCIFLKCEKFANIDINILKIIFKQAKKEIGNIVREKTIGDLVKNIKLKIDRIILFIKDYVKKIIKNDSVELDIYPEYNLDYTKLNNI